MRKLLFILLAMLLAGTALSREVPTLRNDLPLPTGPLSTAGDCAAGNSNTGAILGYYDSWFLGFESYSVPINAGQSGCICTDGGVKITTIHMLIALDEFANLDVAVAVLDAETDGAGCLSPGAEIAVSAPVNFSGIPSLAYYDLAIPIEAPCATVGDAQFLSVYFLNDNDSEFFGLPITAPPHTCFNYNEWGAGQVDVVDTYGFGGDILIWADMDCCSVPVPTDNRSFGTIKGLFR